MNLLSKTTARENMLKSQILTGHVLDASILAALAAVNREEFVPPAFRGAAYIDQEIPLGKNRYLMEPLDFARLLKYAAIARDETVLDIACAMGYSTAVISHLARKVVAVEEEASLAEMASRLLSTRPNVAFMPSPLLEGARVNAPYDVILIEGAIEYLPQAIVDQLREGGRLLTCEHDTATKVGIVGLSKLVEYQKIKGRLYKTVLRDANTARLAAFARPVIFSL